MKTFIKNRDNNSICIVAEGPDSASKLAFVMHGLSGHKDQYHIRSMIEAFLDSGYKVVSFDAVHTFGESKGGKYEDATVTNYYADLEDVITWAGTQSWYKEPFVLCGHSLGGISIALYAQNHPEKVKALAPVSTVVSGKLSTETPQYSAGVLREWQQSGFLTSSRSNGGEKRLKWEHMPDRLKYDLLPAADKLTMPVLFVVGSNDVNTPPEHQKLLYDKIPGPKEIHIIEGATHNFAEPDERQELKGLIIAWLNSVA